jgi:predicted DNA-binding transcriptional regulator AlpA
MSLEFSPIREGARGSLGSVGRMLISDIEVAALLSCSRATVWRRVADGTLPAPLKFGGLSRFVLSEISARIESAKAARAGSGDDQAV